MERGERESMREAMTVYLAIQEGAGFRLVEVAEHMVDNTDHGSDHEEGSEPKNVSRVAPGWWRFDTEVTLHSGASGYVEAPDDVPDEQMRECYYYSSGHTTQTVAILCQLGSPTRCARLPLSGRDRGASRVECTDGRSPPPWAADYERVGTEDGEESRWEILLVVVADDPAAIRIRLGAGEGYTERDAPECIAVGDWVDAETLFDGDCALYSR